MKKLLSVVMSVCLLAAFCFSASAANSGNSVVKIEVEATQMDVSVPSEMIFVFNADGTNTYPNNVTITNNSISNIYLSQVDLDGASNGWKLLKDDFDVTNLSINEKATVFKMGLSGQLKTIAPTNNKDATGSATWTQNEFTINAGASKTFAFDIERAAFNQPKAEAPAYNVTMSYDFCAYA